jgi:hypothetical protein
MRYVNIIDITLTEETVDEFGYAGSVNRQVVHWVASINVPINMKDGTLIRSGPRLEMQRYGGNAEEALDALVLAIRDQGIKVVPNGYTPESA